MGQVGQLGLANSYARAKQAIIRAYMSGNNPMTLQDAQAEVENAVLTQSYLRFEQTLNNTSTFFNFPVLNNQTGGGQVVTPTEQRLNQQDAFYVQSVAIYLALGAGSALQPHTYPSPTVFTTGAASLYAFYNGKITITINNSVIGPGWDLLNFLQQPQTQATAATNSPVDQFDPSMVNLWEPNVALIGTKNNVLVVTLPSNIATIDANTRCIIIARGVLAQNVTLMS